MAIPITKGIPVNHTNTARLGGIGTAGSIELQGEPMLNRNMVKVTIDGASIIVDAERLALAVTAVSASHCRHCGRLETAGRSCQCWNNE